MTASSISKFDVKAYLDNTGIPYWTEGPNVARGWIGITCIYCDDHHNHLGINLRHKNFHCWICLATGSAVQLIMDLERAPFAKARRRIEEFPQLFPDDTPQKPTALRKGDYPLPLGSKPALAPAAINYLLRRGFHDPLKLRDTWDLHAALPYGPWKHRIIIPIRAYGATQSWTSLDYTDRQTPKYKAAEDADSMIPISHLLYGIDHTRREQPVVVVEGPVDAWKIGPGAVSMLGMTATPQRITALELMEASRYFIMFDSGERELRNAQDLAMELGARGLSVEVLELAEGDPGDLSQDDVSKLREEIGL